MSSAENSSDRLLSVIMPTFNRASMTCRAIDSLIAQQFEDWELAVADDGSTDDTGQKVLSYKDDRIRYFRSKTRSVASPEISVSRAREDTSCEFSGFG